MRNGFGVVHDVTKKKKLCPERGFRYIIPRAGTIFRCTQLPLKVLTPSSYGQSTLRCYWYSPVSGKEFLQARAVGWAFGWWGERNRKRSQSGSDVPHDAGTAAYDLTTERCSRCRRIVESMISPQLKHLYAAHCR